MNIQRPRGTADILPGVVENWQRLEQIIRQTLEPAGFGEIRTPIFEHTELFERGVGDTTDIVQKEMYTFLDRGDRSITLRPEGTAGVTRAYVENKLYGQTGAVKLYYMGPMFRYEKPQKGRWRQFHQYGCEVFGAEGPDVDAEVIQLNLLILQRLGLKDLTVELNSVGCAVCRPHHKELMVAALLPYKAEFCSDCQSRLERNPLRMFDCKNDRCQALLKSSGAPKILDVLCEDCETHFAALQDYLRVLDVPFMIQDQLVRGLDYYTRTAWEITNPGYSAIAGGGRYNSLVAQVGGPETPGIGFAGGIERALLVLEEQTGKQAERPGLDVFVAVADASANIKAMQLLRDLRERDLRTNKDYQGRSLKAQLKMADRERARFVVILGESELTEGVVTVKDLQTAAQEKLPFAAAAAAIKARF